MADHSAAERPFSVALHALDQQVTVVASGEIDVATASEFEACIDEALTTGAPVLIDLSAVTFVDSTGLRVIVGAAERSRGADGSLRLLDPSSTVMRTLTVTHLDDVVGIVESGTPD